jgi:hypothetical protein
MNAEIARARSAVVGAKLRVDQEVRAYGKAHVAKLTRRRWEEATKRLTWLLSTPLGR